MSVASVVEKVKQNKYVLAAVVGVVGVVAVLFDLDPSEVWEAVSNFFASSTPDAS